MRIVHPAMTAPIVFSENTHQVLVVENTELYRKMISDLFAQTQGEEGEFVLSKDFEPIECQKHLHVVLDFFHISANDKKLQTKFVAVIKNIVNYDLTVETAQVVESLHQYLSAVIRESPYDVDIVQDIDPMAIIKATGLQLHMETENLLDRLISYLSLCHELLPLPCFVLIGMSAYFNRDEIAQLQEMAAYKKWNLLRIEHTQAPPLLGECHRIIDEDLCELFVDLRE